VIRDEHQRILIVVYVNECLFMLRECSVSHYGELGYFRVTLQVIRQDIDILAMGWSRDISGYIYRLRHGLNCVAELSVRQ
jgi:hypothetical protein